MTREVPSFSVFRGKKFVSDCLVSVRTTVYGCLVDNWGRSAITAFGYDYDQISHKAAVNVKASALDDGGVKREL